jgi:ech hydrogenase subunit D
MSEKEIQSIDEIDAERLLPEVDTLRSANWRLIQVLCISSAWGAELSYSFGSGLKMRSLRIRVPHSDSVPSITALYPAAFLYENEIRDLFGVDIERIGADWAGKVYDVAKDRPFSKVTITGPRSESPEPGGGAAILAVTEPQPVNPGQPEGGAR